MLSNYFIDLTRPILSSETAWLYMTPRRGLVSVCYNPVNLRAGTRSKPYSLSHTEAIDTRIIRQPFSFLYEKTGFTQAELSPMNLSVGIVRNRVS
jgi:hypothetical protein